MEEIVTPGNTDQREGSVPLTSSFKITCFVKMVNNIFKIKSRSSKPVSTRRSTVLSLPLQKGFPENTIWHFVADLFDKCFLVVKSSLHLSKDCVKFIRLQVFNILELKNNENKCFEGAATLSIKHSA